MASYFFFARVNKWEIEDCMRAMVNVEKPNVVTKQGEKLI
jgi:hypothetical protein